VLQPGTQASFDNGYAGITSVFRDPISGDLLGFYHAEDNTGLTAEDNPSVKAAYWSIGLARSATNGRTFQSVGRTIGSSVSRDQMTRRSQGVGDPHVVVDPTDSYLYAYYTDLTLRHEHDRTAIGLARCRIEDAARLDRWFKYYDGRFDEPGLGGNETAVVSPPASFPSGVFQPHVTYLSEWKKYIMVCCVLSDRDFHEERGDQGGIFYCYSSDGVQWSEPELLSKGFPHPLENCEYHAHPTLCLEAIRESSAEGWVYYCYSPQWGEPHLGGTPHFMVRRPIKARLGE
jgi:hypothetical protein